MKKKRPFYSKQLLAVFSYVCILLYASVFNNSSGWFMFYFMTILFLFSYFSISPHFKNAELNFEKNNFYHQGIKNQLEITLSRKWTFLGLGVRVNLYPIEDKGSFLTKHIAFVMTGKKEVVILEWMPMKRGIYKDLSLMTITQDYFKIFSKRKKIKLNTTLFVLPRENKEMSKTIYSTITELSQFKDWIRTNEVQQYRTYQEGDSWRFIDWKLSAKNQEIILKEFELEKEKNLHLIFLGQNGSQFEDMLSCYYTFQKELTNQIDFNQTIICKEACYSNPFSEELFATLTPIKEVSTRLNEIEILKGKIILIFLTNQEGEVPEAINELEKQNLIYYLSISNKELIIRKNG